MAGDRETFMGEFRSSHGRVLDRDLFFFLLDLEVKRARRYQNFLCLLILIPKIKTSLKEDNGNGFETCYQTLIQLLTREVRETDLIGSLGEHKLAVLLPYADVLAGGHAKSRHEKTLEYYDFHNKGFEVMVDQVCFPMNGADTGDLLRKALGAEV